MNYTSKNPDFENSIRAKMAINHFMQYVGFKPLKIEAGYVEGELILEKHHLQQNGFVHGGITSTLADIVMGFAAYSLVEEGHGTVTSDLKVAYLRPGLGSRVIARGRVIKPGAQLFYCEADIICEHPEHGESLIARGYSTMAKVKHPLQH